MRTAALLLLAALTPCASAGYGELIATLRPSDSEEGDGPLFGYSVALDGDTAVVGSPWHRSDGGRVFMFNSQTGESTGVISDLGNPNPTRFGMQIEAGDGLIAVSQLLWQPIHRVPSYASDSVPIYDSATGAVISEASVDNYDSYFGATLSINQGEVLIGAPKTMRDYFNGSFYLHTVGDPSMQVFDNPDPSRPSFFGHTVAMNDRYIVALEPYRATLRRYDRATGHALPSFILSEREALFPASNRLPPIDLDDDTMIVGSVQDDVALVYSLETGELLQTLTPSIGEASFRRDSLAIDDGIALISAFSRDDGRARVFAFDVESGAELGELTADTPSSVSFGYSIDLEDGVALVSAIDFSGSWNSEAYLFRLVPEPSALGLLAIALLASPTRRRSARG